MFVAIKKFLIKILEYFRYKKSYSQDGEDVVFMSLIEQKKQYKGYFVDVGAHHPVRFSNTWALYKRGWRGINIDPTPGSMRPFRWLRWRDVNLEIGVGPKKDQLIFHCFNDPALNTFDVQLAEERNTGKPYKIIKTVKVEIAPLSSILDKYLPAGQSIDMLTIDVEGLDFAVLQSNNWDKFKPRVILVEDPYFDIAAPKTSEIYRFLTDNGYEIVTMLKRTVFYRCINKP
jgi:FkbM family methyltransferase